MTVVRDEAHLYRDNEGTRAAVPLNSGYRPTNPHQSPTQHQQDQLDSNNDSLKGMNEGSVRSDESDASVSLIRHGGTMSPYQPDVFASKPHPFQYLSPENLRTLGATDSCQAASSYAHGHTNR